MNREMFYLGGEEPAEVLHGLAFYEFTQCQRLTGKRSRKSESWGENPAV